MKSYILIASILIILLIGFSSGNEEPDRRDARQLDQLLGTVNGLTKTGLELPLGLLEKLGLGRKRRGLDALLGNLDAEERKKRQGLLSGLLSPIIGPKGLLGKRSADSDLDFDLEARKKRQGLLGGLLGPLLGPNGLLGRDDDFDMENMRRKRDN